VWHERARALLGEESAERTEELVVQLRHLAEKQSNLHLPPGRSILNNSFTPTFQKICSFSVLEFLNNISRLGTE
jgi:hypothetical protein